MCHSRQHRRIEPATRRDPALRASDSERETIVSQLREHGASGRLDVEELEQRVETAYSARTHGELGALIGDLPATRRPVAPVHDHGWNSFFAVNLLLVAIWAVSGAGYFWPVWVMVWWAFALVLKSGPRLLRLR